jgi:hypothetical protein
MKMLVMFLIALLCAGCDSVQYAPIAQDTAAKEFSTTPDKATLYVYRRPALMWAKGQTAPITIDGIVVCALRPGDFMIAKVIAGNHAITSATMDTLRVQAETGKNYFIRESQTFAGSKIVLMNETDGEKEVSQCKLLVNLADDSRLEPNPK